MTFFERPFDQVRIPEVPVEDSGKQIWFCIPPELVCAHLCSDPRLVRLGTNPLPTNSTGEVSPVGWVQADVGIVGQDKFVSWRDSISTQVSEHSSLGSFCPRSWNVLEVLREGFECRLGWRICILSQLLGFTMEGQVWLIDAKNRFASRSRLQLTGWIHLGPDEIRRGIKVSVFLLFVIG